MTLLSANWVLLAGVVVTVRHLLNLRPAAAALEPRMAAPRPATA